MDEEKNEEKIVRKRRRRKRTSFTFSRTKCTVRVPIPL